jgi:hypothetical protein
MNKKELVMGLLFFISLPGFSQLLTDKWKITCGDCNSPKATISFWQRWYPFAGIHFSGDAEMFYIGPSIMAGTDFRLRKLLFLSTYFHYFNKIVNHKEDYSGFFEKGRFRTLSGALLLQMNTGKSLSKSFYIGAGVSLQKWMDRYNSSYKNWDKKRLTFIPAYRVGYFFPFERHKLAIEFNATGPYSYIDDSWSATEIFTQVSLGCRFIF